MTFRITDQCVECRACLVECPHQAIAWARDRGGRWRLTVLPSACTHCWLFDPQPQCVKVCPVNGIALDPDQPVPPVHLIREEIERMSSGADPLAVGRMISRLRREILEWVADLAGAGPAGINVEKVLEFDNSLSLLEGEFAPTDP